MAIYRFGVLAIGLVLAAGPAWALSDADAGSVWAQAPAKQKIALVNILSRDLGVDPGKLEQCLENTFGDPVNAGKTILDAARECKAKH